MEFSLSDQETGLFSFPKRGTKKSLLVEDKHPRTLQGRTLMDYSTLLEATETSFRWKQRRSVRSTALFNALLIRAKAK
jgi:hypothetical protein